MWRCTWARAPDSNLAVRRLREVRTLLCASLAYLAEQGQPAHPSDLAQHRCLAHSTYEPHNWFFRCGEEVFVQPLRPHATTASTAMLRQLALQGVGIARMSARMLADDLPAVRW